MAARERKPAVAPASWRAGIERPPADRYETGDVFESRSVARDEAERRARLTAHALGQHAAAIVVALPREYLLARHAHRARPDAFGGEFFLRFENQRDFRAARNEHDFG